MPKSKNKKAKKAKNSRSLEAIVDALIADCEMRLEGLVTEGLFYPCDDDQFSLLAPGYIGDEEIAEIGFVDGELLLVIIDENSSEDGEAHSVSDLPPEIRLVVALNTPDLIELCEEVSSNVFSAA